MKLSEFIKNLQEFAKKNPGATDLEVIYAKDDEGNGYQKVHYKPSKGVFEDGYFISPDNPEDMEEYGYADDDINVVCIN
jgi:hypothetical protein